VCPLNLEAQNFRRNHIDLQEIVERKYSALSGVSLSFDHPLVANPVVHFLTDQGYEDVT
jgi:hypothetical protein